MATAIEVNEADLRDYQQILQIFEAGDALGGFAGRIKELAKVYKASHPSMKALGKILAEVRYQDELANKMQTFASDKDRSEGEVFDEQAITVGERIKHAAGKVERLAIDKHTATFLGVDEGSHATTALQGALSERIRDYYLKLIRDVIANGFQSGILWDQIAVSARSLRTKLEMLVSAEEADTILVKIESYVGAKAASEQKVASNFSSASLLQPPSNFGKLAGLIQEIEFEGLETGKVALLSNRFFRSLEDLYEFLGGHTFRIRREAATQWLRQLERLKARSESEEWSRLLQGQRTILAETTEAVNVLRIAMEQLQRACQNVDTKVRPEHRRDGSFFGVEADPFRKSWGKLEQPLSKLRKWLDGYHESVQRLQTFVPRSPPAVDAAVKTWRSWTSQTEKALAEFLGECGVKDAVDIARDCINATQRELNAWQIRQRTSAEVIKQIDSGAPWEKVAAAAQKAGELDVAGSIKSVMVALQAAQGWRSLVSVCDGMAPTSVSLAMYTLSKSDNNVERLASRVLDAVESGDELSGWFDPWLDAFDDDSPQWFVLLRYAGLTQKVLKDPSGSMQALLELSAEDGKSASLLEAHRIIRGIREPEIDPARFPGIAAQRVRQLLTDLKRARDRAEVHLEARIAFYAALALVPLNEGTDGPRPRWGLRDATAWDAHLSQEWHALLKTSDEFYWKTRALAPLSRRMGYKREFALLSLTETVHLSPGVLEPDATGGSSDERSSVPSATEILTLVMAMERAAATVTTTLEVLASVRRKLEQQLGHIGLGLLTLDLERPGEYGASKARWVSQIVQRRFGSLAATRQLLKRLHNVLDDAEWVVKRSAALDGASGDVQAALRESLDIARASEAGAGARLSRVLESLISVDDNTASVADITIVVTEALALSGTRAVSNQGPKIFWEYAMASIQEYVLRYTKCLAPEMRQGLVSVLRYQVIDSPNDVELRRRLDRLAFVDADDSATKALSSHIPSSSAG